MGGTAPTRALRLPERDEAVDRLGITNPETVRALQRCAAGLKGGPVPSEVGRDDDFFKSMSEQRRVPRKRPEEAYARDLTFRSGERWLWDISVAFECAFDGVRYLVIFVCRQSGLVRIYPVKDKSAKTVIEFAIEPVRVFVRTTRPDVRQDNAEERAYNAQLADSLDPHPALAREHARDERLRAAHKAPELPVQPHQAAVGPRVVLRCGRHGRGGGAAQRHARPFLHESGAPRGDALGAVHRRKGGERPVALGGGA